MIAVDTNILVYAHRAELPRHAAAREALRGLAEGAEAWAIPGPCLVEFVRVATHPRILRPPSSLEQAVEALDGLLASPSLRVLHAGPRHWQLLRELLKSAAARGNLGFDAAIAAICLENGARTILSEDRDFLRFPALQRRGLDEAG